VKRIAGLLVVVVMLASGTYTFIYLYDWNWTRSLWMAIVFVAAEVAGATMLILRRLDRRDGREEDQPDAVVLRQVRDARPERRHFAWLDPADGRMNVFITMLVGGGLLVSAVAWVVERIARQTVDPRRERRLADELTAGLALPEILVPEEAELLAEEHPYRADPDLALLLGVGDKGGRP
jgi:hypothetical protein